LVEEFDVIVRDASIVDGSGRKAFVGSIGVVGEKVAAVGKVVGDAKRVIEAKGLTALPGFIDAHSHHDGLLLWYPRCESYVMQGVTTFVGGQCGSTMAPIGDKVPVLGRLSEYVQELCPHKYYPDKTMFPIEDVNELMKEKFGWTIDWRTMGEFFSVIERRGISMNFAPLVGHGTVRRFVMGEDYKRFSTEAEQVEMDEQVRIARGDGCIGMSAGLDYDPDVFASREEMNRHVAILREFGGVYCPHWRRTGRRRGLGAGSVKVSKIDGLLEIIDTCRVTGVPLHFAHISTGWYVEPIGAPELIEEANVKATLQVVDKAREEGLDVTYDAIPQLEQGGFENLRFLCSLLTPWLRELGSREALGKWLRVPDFREEVKEAIQRGRWYMREGWNPNLNPRWAENITVLKHSSKGCDGKTLAKIAEERKREPFDVYLDLISEDPDARAVTGPRVPSQSSKLFYLHPAGMVGLDTSARDDKWEGKDPPYGIPGVNTFNAFPLLYKQIVERDGQLTIEEFAQKTSTMPAKVHGIEGRGVIKKGGYADIVLIDLPHLKVVGNAMEPRRHPKGIEYVLVNGTAVVEKGKHTGATPGKVLKKR